MTLARAAGENSGRHIAITAIAFYSATVAWGITFYGHSVYMAALQDRHGWSASSISSAISLGWVVGILATMFYARLIERGRAALVVALGVGATALSVASLGQISAPWQLFLAFPLMACGYPALAAPAISAILSDWFRVRYGLALSLALSGASLGGALLPPLMVWGMDRYGFAPMVAGVGALALVTMLPLAGVVRALGEGPIRRASRATGGAAGDWDRGKLFRAPAFWRISVACGLALFAQVGFLAHQVPLLVDDLGVQAAALAVSVTAIAAGVGRLLVGYLSDRLSLNLLTAACHLVQLAGFVLVLHAEGETMLFVGAAIVGLPVGAIVMLPPLLLRQAFGPRHYGRVYALANVGLALGIGLGPGVVGRLKDLAGGYGPTLWMLAAVHLVAALTIYSGGGRRGFRRPT